MTEAMRIALCCAACALGFAFLQRLALRGARLSPAADALAALFGLYAACFFLFLSARPFMSALLALSLLALLLVVNRAKEKALREALVPADIYLLRQAFLYPHLYLPFLPMKGIVAGLSLLCLALGALLLLEGPAAALRRPDAGAALLCAVLALPAILFLMRGGHLPGLAKAILRIFPPTTDPTADASRNGYMAVLVNHPAWAGDWKTREPDFLRGPHVRPAAGRFPESMEQMLAELKTTTPDKRPHIVLLQAESFCDIRKYVQEPLKSALADFLPNWDKLKAQGRAFDPPENAYGAYTMRTEFAMLTGLRAHNLGPWAFNPYLLAAKKQLWSLARYLIDNGYTTLCLHPYHKDFFSRNQVLPNLGFQRFFGIEELHALEKFGPYVSDKALAERILHELDASTKPVFCFSITMEAHGPWLDGRLTEEEMAATLADVDLPQCDKSLRMYLCHLRHMDAMFGMLMTSTRKRDVNVWAYGDHMPGLA